MSLRKDFDKLIWSLITAALLGLVGWVYTTGNRVTALEEADRGLHAADQNVLERLDEIHKDVREIRNWVVPEKPAGQR